MSSRVFISFVAKPPAKRSSLKQQVPVARMGPVLDVAGCWRFRDPTHFRYHAVLHHLIFVEQGGVKAKTPQGTFSARPGDLLCLRPARWSEYQTSPETIMYQITVAFCQPPFQLATPVLPRLGLLPFHVATGEFRDVIRNAFNTICIELPRAAVLSQLRCKTAIYQILESIAAVLTHTRQVHSAQDDEWETIRIKVMATGTNQVELGALARDMGYSPQHFRHLFKEHFGETAQHVQMTARLQAAMQRLREGHDSIKSIANDFGFSGAKGLTRAIQKHFGLTASEIRTNPEKLPSLAQVMSKPFALNHHILPPGNSLERLVKRYAAERTPLK